MVVIYNKIISKTYNLSNKMVKIYNNNRKIRIINNLKFNNFCYCNNKKNKKNIKIMKKMKSMNRKKKKKMTRNKMVSKL